MIAFKTPTILTLVILISKYKIYLLNVLTFNKFQLNFSQQVIYEHILASLNKAAD